jgi:hypothetical protein
VIPNGNSGTVKMCFEQLNDRIGLFIFANPENKYNFAFSVIDKLVLRASKVLKK